MKAKFLNVVQVSQRISALAATGWVAGMFAVQQVLRLGTSVVLARLLAPELLGTMALINSLRTGGELLSDLGIGQSIVKDRRGGDPTFYSTAWTMQIIRGFALFISALVATWPLSAFFHNTQLLWLIPACSLIFVINGLSLPTNSLLQRRLQLRRLSIFNILLSIASALIHIALAAYTQTIWALVAGLLISAAISAIGSVFLADFRSFRIALDRSAYKSIFHFGKWIFVSSLVYFGATNFDRLYFAKAVPLEALGVYGIARTLADAVSMFTQRVGILVVFPRISSSNLSMSDLRLRILPLRRAALVISALALAFGVAAADQFIFFAYDARYKAAAVFLPLMLIGAWFSILGAFADAMLMGIGKPANVAYANAAKLLTIVIAVPAALGYGGMVLAVCVFCVSEFVRYVILVLQKRSAGLAFSVQDIWVTGLFVLSILLWRETFALLGVTDGFGSWGQQLNQALA